MTEQTLLKLNRYLEGQKVFAHKIKGHPLENYQEPIKKIYIKLLTWLIEAKPEINSKQQSFLEGLKSYMHHKDIELEHLEEEELLPIDKVEVIGEVFLKYFRGDKLKYNFVLDTLLILMSANDTQMDFVQLVCENLELKEEEISFLIALATCILEEDTASYMHLIERVPSKIQIKAFRSYIKPFLIGRLIDEEAHLVYYAKTKASFNEIFKGEEMSMPRWVFKQDVIIFENWKIDLSSHKWVFRNNEKVIFRNCEISGDHEPICFDGTMTIILEDCKFMDFSNRVLVINDCMKLNIKGCQFRECIYLYDIYQNSNGTIYFIADKGITLGNELREVLIEDTQFIDCCVWNKEGHYYSEYSLGYSMNMSQRLVGCTFKNCLSYMGTPKRLCDGGTMLFNQADSIACTLIASHPLSI